MATTIHAGDCSTDCETCRLQCECGTCLQNKRIRQNIQSDLMDALESGDFEAFEEIFEDRDPLEFI